ncbi:MAG: sodium-independent anion transporter [Crocinitomicaceae bacterium]|nr:sodium-independent anion transporter [Crocinitomicaceae bacterium]
MLKKILPIIKWVPHYSTENLKADLPAGLTVGVMLIPQGMAYAIIAGLPVEYGLYAALIPQIIYALTGTSRQLAVGPVAMDSLLVAAGLSAITTIGSDNYIGMAILLAFMMGCLLLIMGILRAGFLVNVLTKPIISGFTSAAALIIAANQISNLSGIPIERNTQIQYIAIEGVKYLNQFNKPTLIIGLSTISLITILSKIKFKIKIPIALITLVLGIICVNRFNLQTEGVKIVGTIPSGLPSFKTPLDHIGNAVKLIPIAFTLALVAFMEAFSVSKALSEKHGYTIDPNQELRALGISNIIGSFFQSYPTTGGFSRTAVNDQAGASTPLSSLFAASLIALTLLFFTPLFYHLPLSVLAAIIITAVLSLFDFKFAVKLWETKRLEAMLLISTFGTTLFIGMVEGIIVGIVLSIALIFFNKKL